MWFFLLIIYIIIYSNIFKSIIIYNIYQTLCLVCSKQISHDYKYQPYQTNLLLLFPSNFSHNIMTYNMFIRLFVASLYVCVFCFVYFFQLFSAHRSGRWRSRDRENSDLPTVKRPRFRLWWPRKRVIITSHTKRRYCRYVSSYTNIKMRYVS